MLTEIAVGALGTLAVYGLTTVILNDRATTLINDKEEAIAALLSKNYELIAHHSNDCAPCAVTFSLQKEGDDFEYGLPSRIVYPLLKKREFVKLYRLSVAEQEKRALALKKKQSI